MLKIKTAGSLVFGLGLCACTTLSRTAGEPVEERRPVTTPVEVTGAATVTAEGPVRHINDCDPNAKLDSGKAAKKPSVEVGVSKPLGAEGQSEGAAPTLYSRYNCP